MMRCAILLIFVCALYAGGVLAASGKTKAAKCNQACEASDDLICASPNAGTASNIRFGSDCVLEQYNCEHPDAVYTKTSEDKCHDKSPVRL